MDDAHSFAVAIPAKQPRCSPPSLLLQLGFLGAFSRELFDAGFSFAVDFGCEWRAFYRFDVTDGAGWGLTIYPLWLRGWTASLRIR